MDNGAGRLPGAVIVRRVETRFLTITEVAEELNTSAAQVYALVRGGALRALKMGGRGQWRIGRQDLEDYIAKTYRYTEQWIAEHPFPSADGEDGDNVPPD